MKRILIAAANPGILAACAQILDGGDYPDVEVVDCNDLKFNDELLEILVEKKPDVVISRGERKNFISNSLPAVTVLDMPPTAFDLLRTLEKAREYGRTVALIGDKTLLMGLPHLERLLDMRIMPFPLGTGESLQHIIGRAIGAGADVLMGGHSVLSPELLGMRFPMVSLGVSVESLLRAIEEARRVAVAIEQQKRQQNLLQTFLNHTSSGIVAVNCASTILAINPAAQRLLQIPEPQAMGRPLDEVCPPLSLAGALASGSNESDAIVRLPHTTLVCDKIAMRVDGAVVGALCMFQHIDRLRRSEAAVRRRVVDTGLAAKNVFEDILGHSPEIHRAVENAKSFAITESTVLLLGESGTGKELFAQSIHNYSKRSRGPFVAINCAALPATLLESELFGYEPGAFTGARAKGKPGMFELAHEGTLFLDEIGDMDLQLQSKLLRALQESKIMRLGGDHVLPVNVRLITATNRNLFECIAKGNFRQDLYYRLNVLKLLLPPLRQCPGDVAVLAKAFFKRHATAVGSSVHLAADAVEELQRHTWPGNVRELLNLMERLVVMYGRRSKIDAKIIREILSEEQQMMQPKPQPQAMEDDVTEIYRVLATTNGNYTQAARILGLSRVTLWRKLKRNTANA